MCDKAILENGGKCVIKQLINTLVDYNLFPNAENLQKCYNTVYRCFLVFDSILDEYKTQ